MDPLPTPPPGPAADAVDRRRRWLVFLFWTVVFAAAAIGNILTNRIDADRYGIPYTTWHIVLNEVSSPAVSLLLLPFLLLACDR